jgi:hypothetical protein
VGSIKEGGEWPRGASSSWEEGPRPSGSPLNGQGQRWVRGSRGRCAPQEGESHVCEGERV